MEKSKKKSTKKKDFVKLIGYGRDLQSNILPSNGDVLRYYLSLEEQNAFQRIVDDVRALWASAGIPMVSRSRTVQVFKRLHYEFRHIRRQYKPRKNTVTMLDKIKRFKAGLPKLFDISACKCKGSCSCDNQLSVKQRQFLQDQRSYRSLSFKYLESNENVDRIAGSSTGDNETIDEEVYTADDNDVTVEDCDDTDDECSTTDDDDTIKSNNVTGIKYNTLDLKPVALVADRYGVANPATAAIVSATLQMVGLISDSDMSLVVDEHKVKRCREKLRAELSSRESPHMIALYFDGRKDKTLYMERGDDRVYRQRCKKEEHISLVGEPGHNYLGHISLASGTAKNIENGISETVKQPYLAVGSDGTVTNTGWKGGVIRLIELRAKAPMQWLICQLHLNELPLRALFTKIDGPTTGPSAFSGPIGSSLKNSINLPIVKFRRIASNLPPLRHGFKTDELSTDQRYLYEMCEAISSGVCDEALSERNPGNISHARWLTLSNNCLRLYVGTLKPTEELKQIVTYIVKVYAPAWFTIKINHKCFNGAPNLWFLIKSSRYLDLEYRTVVNDSIQRNAFFAHPENILLAMLHDSNTRVRNLALQRILETRSSPKVSQGRMIPRKFTVPDLNFAANVYYKLIDWTKVKVTEPPLTKNIPTEQLQDLAENGKNSSLWESEIFELSCHTQATERTVKLVTEVSARVADPLRRDGYIRTVLKSRASMKTFGTKKDFRPLDC